MGRLHCKALSLPSPQPKPKLTNHSYFFFRDDPFIKDGDKVLKGNYAPAEENIKFGCSAKYLKIRTKEEWILFQRKIPFFLIYIFSLAYLYPVVMRNVGFYLHHTMRDYVHTNGSLTQKSLYDLGHEVKTMFNYRTSAIIKCFQIVTTPLNSH